MAALTVRSATMAWSVSLGGGTLAAMLGIGGGVIIAPLLLGLGVHALSASMTSTLMVFFLSSATMASYAAKGLIPVYVALLMGGAALVGSVLGTLLISHAIKKSGRTSIVALLLAIILCGAVICTIAIPGRQAVEDLINGVNIGFHDYCNTDI